MLNIQHLQDEIKKLEKKKENLTESIKHQRKHLIFMPWGDLRRDALQYEIEEEEAALDEVKEQIAYYQRLMLYKSLMSLDYRDHTSIFQSFSRTYHIGAFIIHGSVDPSYDYRGYSVRTLLKRLVYTIPNSAVTPLIHFDLSSPIHSSNIDALWRSLAAELKLGTDSQREDIARRVCRRLQTENVILILRGVDYLPEVHLHKIIQEFWGPLAIAAQTAQRPGRFLFLMFLVDYSGRVKDWKISCAERPDDGNWKPHIPIRLPIVTKFSDRDLGGWIEQWSETLFDILPNDLKEGPLQNRVQALLEESNGGVPDLVMWHICDRCGYLLEGVEECLKL